MARLRIPPEQVEVLGDAVGCKQEQFDELLRALKSAPLSVDLEEWEKEVSAKLASFQHPNTLVHAIVALNVTRAHAEPPIAEFVDDVFSALKDAKHLTAGAGKDEAVKSRITELLTVRSVTIATKAIHLKIDHERIFFHCRILTDARPVYDVDVASPPVAALITHTLKLTYVEDDKNVEFYVALDEEDIAELEEVLRRARTKAESLQAVFKAANVNIVRG